MTAVQPDQTARLQSLLAGETSCVRRSLELLGEILTGVAERAEDDEAFAAVRLGAPYSALAVETLKLPPSQVLPVGSALTELLETWAAEIGPGRDDDPAEWTRYEIDGQSRSVPKTLSAFFPDATLAAGPVVVKVAGGYGGSSLTVFAASGGRAVARAAFDRILELAKGTHNVLRGRVLRAAVQNGLTLEPVSVPTQVRADLVVPGAVWTEIDVNVAAVTTRAELMRELRLGTRRGILLAGPPGVGKSAISSVVAAELAGDFTVILVDARAGQRLLRGIYEATKQLGPTVVVLEDIDLYIGDRDNGTGGEALADFLAVLDGTEKYDGVLTIASTNDPAALDQAATRASRFDAVIHLNYPDLPARAAILAGLLERVQCTQLVDVHAVAAEVPGEVSGADLREIVRRAVLTHGQDLSTQRLREVIAAGRWKPAALTGSYL